MAPVVSGHAVARDAAARVAWVGQGVGTMKGDGSISYRGSCYYYSAAPAWSRLNALAAVFEYDVDAQGNTRGQIWEWR